MSDTSYRDQVLAREYWRCAGLSENARSEAAKHGEIYAAFLVEEEKWAERRDAFLSLLGGEIPENPLPGSIEDKLANVE